MLRDINKKLGDPREGIFQKEREREYYNTFVEYRLYNAIVSVHNNTQFAFAASEKRLFYLNESIS